MKKEVLKPIDTKDFKWATMDGRVLTLNQMETSHLFNSFKMVFNHIAEEYGGEPVWFNHKYPGYSMLASYDPKYLARVVVIFYFEIEKRKNLPEKYRSPYQLIVKQILSSEAMRLDASLPLLEYQPKKKDTAFDRYMDQHFHGENGLDLDPMDDWDEGEY